MRSTTVVRGERGADHLHPRSLLNNALLNDQLRLLDDAIARTAQPKKQYHGSAAGEGNARPSAIATRSSACSMIERASAAARCSQDAGAHRTDYGSRTPRCNARSPPSSSPDRRGAAGTRIRSCATRRKARRASARRTSGVGVDALEKVTAACVGPRATGNARGRSPRAPSHPKSTSPWHARPCACA